jgi:prepilin-type processing-associated H-X9-DG protein
MKNDLQYRRFSLVELIVVIAILSTLVSLLSPSLRSTLNKAARMECGKNLAGVGLAMDLYLGDHLYFPGAGVHWSDMGKNIPSYDDRLGQGYDGRSGMGQMAMEKDRIYPDDAEDTFLYRCPQDMDIREQRGGARSRTYKITAFVFSKSSAAVVNQKKRGLVHMDMENPVSRSIHDINLPSQTISIYEGPSDWNTLGYGSGSTETTDRLWDELKRNSIFTSDPYLHGDDPEGNFLMIDGHVEFLHAIDVFHPQATDLRGSLMDAWK